MAIRDLVPWWGDRDVVARGDEARDPFITLHREMDRAFTNFRRAFEGGPLAPWFGSGFGLDADSGSRAKVEETENGVEVRVELPGLEEKDIDVRVASGVLTVKAERTQETKDDATGFTSRSSQSFHQSIALPADMDQDKAEASFRNGLLTVTLPRTSEVPSSVKQIKVAHN